MSSEIVLVLLGSEDPRVAEALLSHLEVYSEAMLRRLVRASLSRSDPLLAAALSQLISRSNDQQRDTKRRLRIAGDSNAWLVSYLIRLARSRERNDRKAAVMGLAPYDGPHVVDALLSQLGSGPFKDVQVAQAALNELALRHDTRILEACCRRGLWLRGIRSQQERFELAERVADRLFLSTPDSRRKRVLQRLGLLSALCRSQPRPWGVKW